MADFLNLPTKEQFDVQNALLASIASHIGTEGIAISSWDDVQRLVRMGLHSKMFAVGDQFIANYNSTPVTWDVIGIDHDIPTDKKYTKSLTIQAHDCIMNCQWDEAEALYYAAAELVAGDYYFVDAYASKNYQFTLTSAVPLGGVIKVSTWATNTVTQIKTYADKTTVSVTETATVTEGNTGTLLTVNDIRRVQYGSNNYVNSAIKQWLNSDAASFEWASKTNYDLPPADAPFTGAGFLKLLDADLAAVLGAVDKQVSKNGHTATDGTGQDTFSDKVFLLSTKEVYGANEGTYTGEKAYAYYSAMAGAATNDVLAGRIKYLASSARLWWLRSPYMTYSKYTRRVQSTGNVDYGYAYSALGLAPACCIV